mgnify:CR=1 FL=1
MYRVFQVAFAHLLPAGLHERNWCVLLFTIIAYFDIFQFVLHLRILIAIGRKSFHECSKLRMKNRAIHKKGLPLPKQKEENMGWGKIHHCLTWIYLNYKFNNIQFQIFSKIIYLQFYSKRSIIKATIFSLVKAQLAGLIYDLFINKCHVLGLSA